jgi:cytochrome c oxidase cbb3-type subunit I/II
MMSLLFHVLWYVTYPLHANSSFVQHLATQDLLNHGKVAYAKHCSGCHGLSGKGDGPASIWLTPRPRDFSSGIFKFRSTELGMMPTDKDLLAILDRGIKGTSMPEFSLHPLPEKLAIIEYIKTFSSAWNEPEKQGVQIFGQSLPKSDFQNHTLFKARALKGRELFIESCQICHGNRGQGDGEGAVGLVDDWGQEIRPANLRAASIKRGRTVEDIYQTLLTGVGGTPMPSFKGVYSDDQLWDLAAYVLYLRGEASGLYSEKQKLPVIE